MGGKHKKNRTRAMVLQAVVDAENGIKSAAVVEIVQMTRAAVQLHLHRLTQAGDIQRRLLGGRQGYIYWVGSNSPALPTPVEEPEESEADIDKWFLAEGFGEAIEAARPYWRTHRG